jgi:hypothetical protein
VKEITSEFSDTLGELEQVLAIEARALKALDRAEIDAAAEQKLALCERIDALRARGRPSPADRERLERIKRAALLNQMLVVHARETVKGILAVATGSTATGYPSQRPGLLDGSRIHLKG